MTKMNMMKESYERSALTITVFTEEDVIATSGFMDDLMSLFGDNDSQVVPNR